VSPHAVEQWKREGVKGHESLIQDDEDFSKPGTLPFQQLWGPEVKYSDQVANGDEDDDKEI